jgi:hypothetical protein
MSLINFARASWIDVAKVLRADSIRLSGSRGAQDDRSGGPG